MNLNRLALFLCVLSSLVGLCLAGDPLPSWNDSLSKKAIIGFVENVTDKDSNGFVPVAERIAVFDNDGTLWPENPLPFQIAFSIDELRRQLPEHPEWKDDKFIQSALAGDIAPLLADHYKGLFHLVAVTGSGMTTTAFADRVREWLATAKHPKFAKAYDQLTYQPMQEVLTYLRSNGFKTFLVSGGGSDFMRVFSEREIGRAHV